jgi:hypothetical protein
VFPSKRELAERTGLSERMVRYHLAALAGDRDDRGQQQQPVLRIVQRRVACDRNTSNVYVIRVPWASQDIVRSELQELSHVPSEAIQGWVQPVVPRVGMMDCRNTVAPGSTIASRR